MHWYLKLDDVESGVISIEDVEQKIVNNDMMSLEQDQEQFDKDEVEVMVKLVKTLEAKRARETRIKNMLVLPKP